MNALYDGRRSTFFKTANGGASWSAGGALRPASLIVVDPAAGATLYAATRSGLLKSTDGGASWHASAYGLPSSEVHALAIDPRNPNTLFAATINRSGGAAIYRSTDGGANWMDSSAGLGGVFRVSVVVMDPANSATLYAATSEGVFKSANGGANWLMSSNGLTYTPLQPRISFIGILLSSAVDKNRQLHQRRLLLAHPRARSGSRARPV